MVNLLIDVTDLGGEARPGDRVVLWKPAAAGSFSHAGRLISTAPVDVPLTDGKATVPGVEPGEMRVLLQCRGVESQGPIDVIVPDGTDSVTLRSLIESQFDYEPPVISAVQAAAANASASEAAAALAQARSEEAADRAEDTVVDAINNGAILVRNEVKQDADRAASAVMEAASILSETLAVVTHGDDPYHPRPEIVQRIMWLGSVVPLYREPGDLVPAIATEPAPWTPGMLDLVAWYDPAVGYTQGEVTSIADRGPYGLHMDVSGTGVMEVASGVLNLPSFQNNGTAFSTSPDLPAQVWDGDVTVYMVAQLSAMPTVSALFDEGGTLAANRAGFWVNSGGRVALTQGTSVQSEPYLVTQDQTFLLTVTFSGGASTQAELNGTVVVGPADAGSNTPGKLRLFANPGGANISAANIGDVIIAKNVTPEQHEDISEWLRIKWGLS